MASKKKTFREKLADPKDFPRVQPLVGKMKVLSARGRYCSRRRSTSTR